MLAEGDAALLAGALLVGLAPAQVDGQSGLGLLEVRDVEGDQLAAAQGSAKPRRSRARSRASASGVGPGTRIRRRSSLVPSGVFPSWAVPRLRRMPCMVVRTSGCEVGEGQWPGGLVGDRDGGQPALDGWPPCARPGHGRWRRERSSSDWPAARAGRGPRTRPGSRPARGGRRAGCWPPCWPGRSRRPGPEGWPGRPRQSSRCDSR
jgi:hypothetical protein